MTASAFHVVGAAHPRAGWFSELARWSTAGLIPVEFEKCLSLDELETRLRSGRRYSAAVIDGNLAGTDRDLLDLAMRSGVPVVVIADASGPEWMELGAAAQLRPPLDRERLVRTLEACGRPIELDEGTAHDEQPADGRGGGQLIAVTGPGGTGASTLAIGGAQALAATGRSVLLADLARRADLALLHDARDLLPGLPELVEAHRHGRLSAEGVRALVFSVDARRYDLLLGLRRPRDWTALRPAAVRAGVESLRGAYDVVIADVDSDVEGEAESGSLDVQERNELSRTCVLGADRVVVVGLPGTKGVAALVRCVAELVDVGVDLGRLIPVLNRAPRRISSRATLVRDVARLLTQALERTDVPPPLLIGEHRRVEVALRDGTPLPGALGRQLVRLATEAKDVVRPTERHPRVEPGTLGSWTPQEAPS